MHQVSCCVWGLCKDRRFCLHIRQYKFVKAPTVSFIAIENHQNPFQHTIRTKNRVLNRAVNLQKETRQELTLH